MSARALLNAPVRLLLSLDPRQRLLVEATVSTPPPQRRTALATWAPLPRNLGHRFRPSVRRPRRHLASLFLGGRAQHGPTWYLLQEHQFLSAEYNPLSRLSTRSRRKTPLQRMARRLGGSRAQLRACLRATRRRTSAQRIWRHQPSALVDVSLSLLLRYPPFPPRHLGHSALSVRVILQAPQIP
jgi:hypothetical protein